MADLDDVTGWNKEYRDWYLSEEARTWSNARRSRDPNLNKRMPIALAVRYVRLLLSDPDKVAAIRDFLEFGERYKGLYDKRNPPEDYPTHYPELVSGFFDWFCWKVDFYPGYSFSERVLQRCAVEVSPECPIEMQTEYLIELIKSYDRGQIFDYT